MSGLFFDLNHADYLQSLFITRVHPCHPRSHLFIYYSQFTNFTHPWLPGIN
jgi:hypothetical protein